MNRNELNKLLDAAIQSGNLKSNDYCGDAVAFAQDVIRFAQKKLTKRQSEKLFEFAKFMF